MLRDHIFQFGHSHQKLTFLAGEQNCEPLQNEGIQYVCPRWWCRWPGVVAAHGNSARLLQ